MVSRFDTEKWKRIEFLLDKETFEKLKEMKKVHEEKNTSKLLRRIINRQYEAGLEGD